MAPNSKTDAPFEVELTREPSKRHYFKNKEIVWRNVIAFPFAHIGGLYGIYLLFTSAQLLTIVFGWILCVLGNIGAGAGAHRLWSHRAYKANLPLRIILMIMETIAFEATIFQWARDHRVHHKYTETDADPHNATRGFFFSHIGNYLVKRHPLVVAKGRTIDVSDLENDAVVMFQKKYFFRLVFIFSFLIPICIPVYLWGESWNNSFFVSTLLRWLVTIHGMLLVNSAAHLWGNKPYDKNINPTQTRIVSILSQGEGWHNYHHTFPWDYRASELGPYSTNLSTAFIDLFAKIGWASGLKTAPTEMVTRRAERTGDGSYSSTPKY